MTMKRITAICALCAMLLLCVGIFADLALAQKDTVNLDKDLAQRRGVGGSLASGDDDKDDGDGPNKTQMIVGVGSIFVMIAVVKWL